MPCPSFAPFLSAFVDPCRRCRTAAEHGECARETWMSNRPRGNPEPAQRPVTRRQQAKLQREANIQRRVVLAIAGAVLLALLLIAAGIVYEQVLVPGRAIKTVNGQTLSRAQYDQIARETTLQQIVQSVQFSKMLGPNASFGQEQGGSFAQQVVQGNQQLAELGTPRSRRQPPAEEAVNSWVDAQLIRQGAREQFQIDPAQGEVDQLIVERLGSLLETPEPVTTTTELTTTADISGTATVTTTLEPETTALATPTVGPTQTPAPTASPTATPLPAEATTKADQIFKVIYDEYTAILGDLPNEASADVRTPHATLEDIAAAVRSQYRDQLIRTRVQERLVAEVNPADTAEPEQIRARHILLKVPEPEPTPTPTSVPEGTATAESTATAEPTPTTTPTIEPTALEALFAERKQEADALYQQVTSNPDSFPDLAREHSQDEASAAAGGELQPFGRGQMVKPFEDAVFALKENEISPPVRSEFGWHIIQRLPEDPQAKLERQRQAAFDTWLSDLRANATILPEPTATPTQVPLPTPDQTETAPDTEATEGVPTSTDLPPSPEPEPEATTATP